MDQMIETNETFEQDIATFYDRLAPHYDAMTGFEKRFVHERPFFRLLVDRYGLRSAVDAGSGSGFHSLLLASLGVQVIAIDISEKMLELLHEHGRQMGLRIRGIQSSFRSLPAAVHEQFDSLFCMGNSLPHLLTKTELRDSLTSFAEVIRPGGVIFLQNLNYDRILAQRTIVQSVKESGGITFVRYYEYRKETIRFHILKLKRENSGITHELNSVELRPILQEDLLQLLNDAGFRDARSFGGVSMEDFQPLTSKDLVVLATRSS